ncbi:MAG TPA: DUF3352 domain-containing protein [Phototrophicaceae bacterium]|nr:DUF3352 domain-containing protein [Phototrophicaceae bacterium]
MKRLLLLLLIGVLLALSTPVLAQTATVDPASYLPADTPLYAETRTDSTGLSDNDQIVNFGQQLLNPGQPTLPSSILLGGISDLLPGIDITTDVLPWLGDHVGIAAMSLDDTASQIVVLPVHDASGALAFITKATAGVTPEAVAGVNLYTTSTASLLVGGNVIWLGAPTAISQFVKTPMLARLSDNPQYQQVRAALPANADSILYASPAYVAGVLASSPAASSSVALFQAGLRLHPAQSAAEDALLQSPALNGMGLAFQMTGSNLQMTGALSVNTQYPAPTLPNASAGTALIHLIPGNSFFVVDSYDLATAAVPLLEVALSGTPITSEFHALVGGAETTLPATPSPAAPITADALVTQFQPLITQVTSLSGLPLDQFYSLIDGEYAVAVFPGAGPIVGAALYLQSSDPQQIIDALDHASHLILINPVSGQQLMNVDHGTVSGTPITYISVPNIADRFALGVIDKNVLFVTQESTLQPVLDAAQKQTPTSPAVSAISAFDAGQEALFYADPRTIDLYNLREQRTPPLPMTAVAGSVDVQGNGLFLLHLTVTMAS